MDARFSELALESLTHDRAPSRRERKQLSAVVREVSLSDSQLAAWRAWAFEQASAHQGSPAVIDWLRELVKVLLPEQDDEQPTSKAFFSPGEDCLRRITSLFRGARRSVDVCVFTITDDRITQEILGAHERGVKVRIITDDDKSTDRGSDILAFQRAHINVHMDSARDHMHHKFAVFDDRQVLTGSYNWTRSAAARNQENIIITDDLMLVESFSDEFERLWQAFSVD